MENKNNINLNLLGRKSKRILEKYAFKNLNLKISQNSIYKKKDILNVIPSAAYNSTFIEGESKLMRSTKKSPIGDDVIYHISKAKTEEIIKISDHAISKMIKNVEVRRSVYLAIDFTEIPFYGKKSTPGTVSVSGRR
jgi:hypothetical protein